MLSSASLVAIVNVCATDATAPASQEITTSFCPPGAIGAGAPPTLSGGESPLIEPITRLPSACGARFFNASVADLFAPCVVAIATPAPGVGIESYSGAVIVQPTWNATLCSSASLVPSVRNWLNVPA